MKGFADAAALESALALLHDAELMEFVQEHQHNYLYRADFMKEPMPGDADRRLCGSSCLSSDAWREGLPCGS